MRQLPILSGLGALLANPALAHAGLHQHPYGVEFAWVIAVALASLGCLGGYAFARAIERRKDKRQ